MKATEPDLTDRIADGLPADIRADFYREMRHCRSLPENDEMPVSYTHLRIQWSGATTSSISTISSRPRF